MLKVDAIKKIAANPDIVQSVVVQNGQRQTLKAIQELDRIWQSSNEITPFKKSLMENKAGILLSRIVELKNDIYSEAFVTDTQGANVAAYPPTTDYWQGDEEKFTESW